MPSWHTVAVVHMRTVSGPGPAVAELWGTGDPSSLSDAERAAVARAVIGRRTEFAAGRATAHAALTQLGVPVVDLLPGKAREPLWPPSVVGSITHCQGYAAAAVGHAHRYLSIGIDAEPDAPLPDEVGHAVLGGVERAMVSDMEHERPGSWGRVVFSAKEAVYKAWFPVCRSWLGFDDVRIRLHFNGTFDAQLMNDPQGVIPQVMHGRWASEAGVIATAVVIKR